MGATVPCVRRWGTAKDDPETEEVSGTACRLHDPDNAAVPHVPRKRWGVKRSPTPCVEPTQQAVVERTTHCRGSPLSLSSLGVRFAGDLFRPQGAALSHDARFDISSIGRTTLSRETPKLLRDFAQIDGNAIYWPGCLCRQDDQSLFRSLYEELPWTASPYRRSRHPACVEETQLSSSATYKRVVEALQATFDISVGFSIANLYADGDDWTEYHRDNFGSQGNRRKEAAAQPLPHNVTVGASLGAPRELRFKHLETGAEFAFPQANGDVFAFATSVNSAFQHSIPRRAPAKSVGPRISVILWGRTPTEGKLLRHPNAKGG